MSLHKIIVVGCGDMANIWMDYVQQRKNAEIVALVDLNEGAAIRKKQQRNLDVPVYTDLKTAIEQTHATLVFDVTIPAAHKTVVSTALNAGCDVFGEKPMAENINDAEEIIKIAEDTGHTYSVMQNRRYLKQIRQLHQLVQNEKFGDIKELHADFFLGPHFGGFRDQMDSPLIIDMAIHTFDQARFIAGCNPTSVYCYEFNPKGSWYDGRASAICIYEMENGSVFSYRGSWCAEGFPTSWESEWRVIGTQGTAKWDGFNTPSSEIIAQNSSTEFIKPTKKVSANFQWPGREGHFGCLDEMFAGLEENRRAETDCHDNIHSMKMVFAALESAKTGKTVEIY
ncbi:Gfo/Idh/MocA family protein [Gracilibacillus kekensis]|uniref:Predicted dehydrogenase n=1 Tax=Gracilibacillus kekensis TaxID=1027249 RepID=A0A1M7N493_9BACI|nr:Gfo/Idh/MocA family oxidoreductase [Gracilibacillus kekensis]SHM98246.1 Predicted dehydrogenase [Gracilibacillus kekensis]